MNNKIEEIGKTTLIVWANEGLEKPIVLRRWNGTIELMQDGQSIMVDESDIDNLCKALKQCKGIVI